MVSVIVPIYNVEKYLRRCLESIQNQSFTDFEVLMIDDGSTDRSAFIAKTFLSDSRFRYYYQENRGVSAARNTGLDNVNGDFICFIDSDDYIEANYLQILYTALGEYQSDIAQCGVYRVWEDGRKVVLSQVDRPIVQYTDILKYISESPFSCWNKLYKRPLFNGLKFPEGIKFEDFALMPQIFYRAKRIVAVNDCLYNYLWRDNSITTTVKIQPDILKAQRILENSEFGQNNSEVTQTFFVRQVMGSLLWAMVSEGQDKLQTRTIMEEGLRKYPHLAESISSKTIGAYKSRWGKWMINGHYVLARLYTRLYNRGYSLLRHLYRLVKG